ncbi:MAG: hypothetical protein H7Y30_02830, partial [Pyrinomonadaceae bacterium]|nr:hypothetical protein [Pyrinomonadaceae bacterium]
MRDAVIVSAVRTAVGKAPKGTLKDMRPDEMGAAVIKEAMARAEGLEATEIDDVIMGCAMPEAEQGMNVARAAAIRAGLPVETSAMTINRFCSSGLQSIAQAADRIRTGGAEVVVAGGLETMSMIPMGMLGAAPWRRWRPSSSSSRIEQSEPGICASIRATRWPRVTESGAPAA